MSKINNIQLTVTIQRNFSFTPDEIRKVYPELDKQGIEDEDIVDWIMDNTGLDFWYISRLDHIGRFGLDFDNTETEEDPLYNDLSEYIDEKDFINILHELFYMGLENPVTWNN